LPQHWKEFTILPVHKNAAKLDVIFMKRYHP